MAFIKSYQPKKPSRRPATRPRSGWERQGSGSGGAKAGLGPAAKPPVQRKAKAPIVGRSAEPDSSYNAAVDLAGRRQTQRLGELADQERAVKHEFGIDDPTNPFSRVEGMKKLYLNKAKAASAGLAAQGHLYSGQHERALSRTRREAAEARANLRAQYEGVIGQIGAQKAGVKFDTEEQRMQAFEDWLARAPMSEAPAEEAGAATSAPSNIGAPATPATSHPGEASGSLKTSFGSGTAKQIAPNKHQGAGSTKAKPRKKPKVRKRPRSGWER